MMELGSGSVWADALAGVLKATVKVVEATATVVAEGVKAIPPLVKGTSVLATEVAKNLGPVLTKVGTVVEKGAKQGAKVAEKMTRKPLLTYREVIEYFTEKRPDIAHIAKGCVYKQSIENDTGFVIYLLFLDENNAPVMDGQNCPYGIKYRVAEIDSELINTFRNKDLIITRL